MSATVNFINQGLAKTHDKDAPPDLLGEPNDLSDRDETPEWDGVYVQRVRVPKQSPPPPAPPPKAAPKRKTAAKKTTKKK